MSVRKTDDFIADAERQFDWYVAEAGWEVANRYLDALEATCRLLGQHPNLGPRGVSLILGCGNGVSSSSPDPSTSTSSFTNWPALTW